ncbi:copper homeostasis periplasmic binding protein CopC [Pseudomonas citronellolis]|uniref:copper homeostasis periplasmic binding protein CopC n=1 Tax=Pseudomonas citronellolis TaxID=53408 RepID=UPI0023E407FA|nr:copper homeostasis periplasmic binding protein CopC [Pseudomonas citronellolis]MDF3936464.1 copper homeostasis periplasmic binding protein CopC [Pseudomonas citronellolis]
MRKSALFATLGLLAVLNAPAVFAHAHLKGEVPAADSTASAPKELRLTFSEGVEAKFTKVSVTGADGKAVKVAGIATAEGDAKVLLVTFEQPLPAGEYKVQWHAVSVDTHKSEGSYAFKVAP